MVFVHGKFLDFFVNYCRAIIKNKTLLVQINYKYIYTILKDLYNRRKVSIIDSWDQKLFRGNNGANKPGHRNLDNRPANFQTLTKFMAECRSSVTDDDE